MTKLGTVLLTTMLVSACGTQTPLAPAAPAIPAPQPYATLAQMMRGIPFPASNIIFDTQSEDPGAAKKATEGARGATASFSSVYGGWQAVENNALAIAETANLLTIPGRMCANGKPVPVQSADWQRFVQGLRDAGMASYKAAQTKDMDKMLDAADTLTNACSECHDVYREKSEQRGGDAARCTAQ